MGCPIVCLDYAHHSNPVLVRNTTQKHQAPIARQPLTERAALPNALHPRLVPRGAF